MATVIVDQAIRNITITLNQAEAQEIRRWMEQAGEPPVHAARSLYAAISAVAEGKDYR